MVNATSSQRRRRDAHLKSQLKIEDAVCTERKTQHDDSYTVYGTVFF